MRRASWDITLGVRSCGMGPLVGADISSNMGGSACTCGLFGTWDTFVGDIARGAPRPIVVLSNSLFFILKSLALLAAPHS